MANLTDFKIPNSAIRGISVEIEPFEIKYLKDSGFLVENIEAVMVALFYQKVPVDTLLESVSRNISYIGEDPQLPTYNKFLGVTSAVLITDYWPSMLGTFVLAEPILVGNQYFTVREMIPPDTWFPTVEGKYDTFFISRRQIPDIIFEYAYNLLVEEYAVRILNQNPLNRVMSHTFQQFSERLTLLYCPQSTLTYRPSRPSRIK